MHVRLLENTALQQQKTYGVLGTNLIYACYHHYKYPNQFLQSLMDSLLPDQLEITMIEMSGHDLDYVDNRLLGVQLVKNGMAKAIIFDRSGKVQTPEDMLYKKNVLAFRGSFRPITFVGFDMIKSSYTLFKKDPDYDKNNTLALCEITLNNFTFYNYIQIPYKETFTRFWFLPCSFSEEMLYYFLTNLSFLVRKDNFAVKCVPFSEETFIFPKSLLFGEEI